jgi:hypothetical protein
MPSFLGGLYSLLMSAALYVALACFVVAAVRLRSEGGINFEIGGPVTKWIFWGLVFLALPSIPLFLGSAGVPVQAPSAGVVSQPYLTGIQAAVRTFTVGYLIGHFVPVIAGALVLKALLDSAEGHSPFPSLVSALFVLSIQGFWTMAQSWGSASDPYGIADGMLILVKWFGSNVCPMISALCIIGAVINFVRGKPWGQLALTSLGCLCFSGIWLLVQAWG